MHDLKIFVFDKVSSTNDVGMEFIQNRPENSLILADVQTRGKGRMNNRVWVSVLGNYHGSFIIEVSKFGLSELQLPILNDVFLQCISDAVLEIYGGSVSVKSPNDILIKGKKVSGVLIEVLYPYAVVGIGINTLSSAINGSTDLFREFGEKVDNVELGIAIFSIFKKKIEHVF
jgi:BirA family biotin operon repressor/biotin-[acetyl-CoA-carboxylase] ligase